MKRTLLLGAIAMTAGVTLVAPGAAQAEERSCRGSLGAVTVDNLRVPDGATCALRGTIVKGTIYVGTNATLTATSVRVVGNIQAEGHNSVTVGLLHRRWQHSAEARPYRASVTSNRVTGDVQSFTNRGTQTIRGNRINGNLQCKENVPAPTGSGNVVGGQQGRSVRPPLIDRLAADADQIARDVGSAPTPRAIWRESAIEASSDVGAETTGVDADTGTHGRADRDLLHVAALGRRRLGPVELVDHGAEVLLQRLEGEGGLAQRARARCRSGRCGTRPCHP